MEEVQIEEESLERDLRIFPNPTNSNFKVSLDNWEGEVRWELRNSIGAIVISGGFVAGEGFLLSVDMTSLSNGIYSLSVTQGAENSMRWVVKE